MGFLSDGGTYLCFLSYEGRFALNYWPTSLIGGAIVIYFIVVVVVVVVVCCCWQSLCTLPASGERLCCVVLFGDVMIGIQSRARTIGNGRRPGNSRKEYPIRVTVPGGGVTCRSVGGSFLTGELSMHASCSGRAFMLRCVVWWCDGAPLWRWTLSMVICLKAS